MSILGTSLYMEEDRVSADAFIGGQLVKASIDTGSTTSFLKQSFYETIKSQCKQIPYEAEIVLADGSTRSTVETIECCVQFGYRKGTIAFIIMPLATEDVILGFNFLYNFGTIFSCAGLVTYCKAQPNVILMTKKPSEEVQIKCEPNTDDEDNCLENLDVTLPPTVEETPVSTELNVHDNEMNEVANKVIKVVDLNDPKGNRNINTDQRNIFESEKECRVYDAELQRTNNDTMTISHANAEDINTITCKASSYITDSNIRPQQQTLLKHADEDSENDDIILLSQVQIKGYISMEDLKAVLPVIKQYRKRPVRRVRHIIVNGSKSFRFCINSKGQFKMDALSSQISENSTETSDSNASAVSSLFNRTKSKFCRDYQEKQSIRKGRIRSSNNVKCIDKYKRATMKSTTRTTVERNYKKKQSTLNDRDHVNYDHKYVTRTMLERECEKEHSNQNVQNNNVEAKDAVSTYDIYKGKAIELINKALLTSQEKGVGMPAEVIAAAIPVVKEMLQGKNVRRLRKTLRVGDEAYRLTLNRRGIFHMTRILNSTTGRTANQQADFTLRTYVGNTIIESPEQQSTKEINKRLRKANVASNITKEEPFLYRHVRNTYNESRNQINNGSQSQDLSIIVKENENDSGDNKVRDSTAITISDDGSTNDSAIIIAETGMGSTKTNTKRSNNNNIDSAYDNAKKRYSEFLSNNNQYQDRVTSNNFLSPTAHDRLKILLDNVDPLQDGERGDNVRQKSITKASDDDILELIDAPNTSVDIKKAVLPRAKRMLEINKIHRHYQKHVIKVDDSFYRLVLNEEGKFSLTPTLT